MKCKSLRKSSNLVRAKVEKHNEADMSRRCCQLVDINRLLESKFPHGISVQYDVKYNNHLYLRNWGAAVPVGDKHTVYSFAEVVTSKSKIIKMVTRNKICPNHGH